MVDPSPKSHPVVRFEQIPINPGPLLRLNSIRPQLLEKVVRATQRELDEGSGLESLLSNALYQERSRLKNFRPNLYTRARHQGDQKLWGEVQSALVQSSAMADRKPVLDQIVRHYAEEIGGRFNPALYHFATRAVPWGFRWLLNAASAEHFLPWGMTESLESRLRILGEVPHLQKLAKKGTVLLVPTHQSNIDSVLVGYVIYLLGLPPFAYGAGLNLFSNPMLSFFMGGLGAYTVDRKKSNPIYKEVLKNYSAEMLREGIHSIFFPGGGRSRSGGLEDKVKLGLMGTGIEAMVDNLREGKARPNVYVVPMTTSYDFVLEASSLIEDYLAESGKHRYIAARDESWQASKVLRFFWKLFSAESGVSVRIGKPLDVFGNLVDEEGRSIGPNGTLIDPAKWLSSRGEVVHDPQRDREYTRRLGQRLVERYPKEVTVLPSQLVAFTLFEVLRKQYSDLDLFRFLRITLPQRTLPLDRFMVEAEAMHAKFRAAADRGDLYLADELLVSRTEDWVARGVKSLGAFHGSSVVSIEDNTVFAGDMQLLYYYRNRLASYRFASSGRDR